MTDAETVLVRRLVKAAKEATNGWACFAKREREHKEIGRLHREIDTVADALSQSWEQGRAAE